MTPSPHQDRDMDAYRCQEATLHDDMDAYRSERGPIDHHKHPYRDRCEWG